MAGRPRLHPSQADKQAAYRKRKQSERENEQRKAIAWERVSGAARTLGYLSGNESPLEAAAKVVAQQATTTSTSESESDTENPEARSQHPKRYRQHLKEQFDANTEEWQERRERQQALVRARRIWLGLTSESPERYADAIRALEQAPDDVKRLVRMESEAYGTHDDEAGNLVLESVEIGGATG